QRLQARPTATDPRPELAQGEPRVERLRPGAVERVVVGAVQPEATELADVPEPQLAAVRELEREPLVRVAREPGRDDEQLACHLEVDRQERAAGELDDALLAPPADGLDAP